MRMILTLFVAAVAFAAGPLKTVQPRRAALRFVDANKDSFQTMEMSCNEDDCSVEWTVKPGKNVTAPPSRAPADRRDEIRTLYQKLASGSATDAEKDRLLLLLVEAEGLDR